MEDLDGDIAPDSGVARTIDLAHPSRADKLYDLVGTEAVANGESDGNLRGDGGVNLHPNDGNRYGIPRADLPTGWHGHALDDGQSMLQPNDSAIA
jgi:hypothetical protein